MQTNVGEFVLEHLKEHGKEMGNCSAYQWLATWLNRSHDTDVLTRPCRGGAQGR